MTPAEKQAVLARIKAVRDTAIEKEVLYPSPIKSPWTVFSFSSWVQSNRLVAGLAAFLIIAVSGNSVVLAANEALPGDALYSLKVNISEPIRVALATGPVKKAEVQTMLVQARFEEAEVLAARGELSDEREQEIADRIDQHLSEVSKNVEEVQKTSPEEAEDANIAVEASMNAHAKILGTLESHKTKVRSLNMDRIATKARETAKRFEVKSDKEVTLAIAPQVMMMSFAATTGPASEEADATVLSVDSTQTDDEAGSSRMMKSAPVVKDHTDSVKEDAATSTVMTVELKKQKKEKEVYEKARQRLDREFKKEELRTSKSGSNKDSDTKDDNDLIEANLNNIDLKGGKGRNNRSDSR